MKYGNRKITTVDGTFDSMKEHKRWCELKLLQRAGEISKLRRQIPFVLIPKQTDEKGKTLERECRYVADFVYEENGQTVVEDSKGMRTKEYIIKRKLMLEKFHIRIKEV
jgi:hypothetical protein